MLPASLPEEPQRNWFNVSAVLENDPQRLTRKSRFWRFWAIHNHGNHGRKLQSQAVTLKLPWLRWFIFRWSWWNDVLDAIGKKWSWTVLKGHITTRSQKTGRSGGFLSNNFQLWGWKLLTISNFGLELVGIFKKCGCPKTGKRLPTRSPQFPVTGFYGQPKINCRGQHITTEGWRTNDSSSSWGPCYSETSRFDMRKFNVHTRFQTKFFRLNAEHIIDILNDFISYGHLNFNRFLCDCWHLAGTPSTFQLDVY